MEAKSNEKESTLRGLRSHQERIRVEMRRLQEDLQAVGRSIEIVEEDGEVGQLPPSPGDPGYANLGIQAAVERFLSERPNKWFKPSGVAKELISRGVAHGTNFKTQVSSALIRAEKKGLVRKEQRNNRSVYSLKVKASDTGSLLQGDK